MPLPKPIAAFLLAIVSVAAAARDSGAPSVRIRFGAEWTDARAVEATLAGALGPAIGSELRIEGLDTRRALRVPRDIVGTPMRVIESIACLNGLAATFAGPGTVRFSPAPASDRTCAEPTS